MTVREILDSAHDPEVNWTPVPDVFDMPNGRRVGSVQDWEIQREGLVEAFADHVYGRTPTDQIPVRTHLLEEDSQALDGLATRQQTRLSWQTEHGSLHADLLLYLPNEAPQPAPVFLGLNFGGNHSVTFEAEVELSHAWFRDKPDQGYVDNRATEASRGAYSGRWPLATILKRGYGVATCYYGDFDPDYHDGFHNGVHGLWPAQEPRPDNGWGAIGAWAWGLSRLLDHLENVPGVDANRVAAVGHSRLGKTALWAAANDQRFAMCISNNSGCGGDSLNRRRFGEAVEVINESFPHWFAPKYKTYAGIEDQLPLDQHHLVALLAPRPVYIASAAEDLWADPYGQLLSGHLASPVFHLYGHQGLETSETPGISESIGDRVGYHLREGVHGVFAEDWEHYLNFADRHLSSGG